MKPPPLNEQLIRLFEDNGSRPLFITETGEQYTYAETLGAAETGVNFLSAEGLCVGDRIGIELSNGPEFAILYLACLLGGFTVVPLNNALPEKDRDLMLEGTRIKLLLAGPSLSTTTCPVLNPPSFSPTESCAAFQLLNEIKPERLFAITFTSGTTSRPKGVSHEVGTLLGNADAFNQQYGVNQEHRMLHIMPMGYMAGLLNAILCPLMAGASIVLAPEFGPSSVLNFWEPAIRNGVNLFWASPTMLETLNRLDRDARGTEYCRQVGLQVFCATAPLPLKTRQTFEQKYGVLVVESYGLSELLLLTANLGEAGTKNQSVGPSLSNVAIRICNKSGEDLPADSEAAIKVRTPYRSSGYLDFESGNPVPPKDEWFNTGDLGYLDADGYLFVTGRCKDLIVRGGFNYSPRTIEEALLSHEVVEEVAVIGVPHSFYGEEIAAIVLLSDGCLLPDEENALRLHCRDTLGPNYVPDRFMQTDCLPKGPTGKIQKELLRKRRDFHVFK